MPKDLQDEAKDPERVGRASALADILGDPTAGKCWEAYLYSASELDVNSPIFGKSGTILGHVGYRNLRDSMDKWHSMNHASWKDKSMSP